MNDSLVSIVVPVYNTEEYMLEKCFHSILNQTYNNIELIIVDDGSKKETAQWLDKFVNVNKSVILIHNQNGGASIARNTGIDLAKGEFITFVDADDWIDLNYIEVLYSKFNESTDIVMCTRQFEFKNKAQENHFFDKDVVFTDNNRIELIKKSIVSGVAGTWCKVYRKSFINKNELKYDSSLRRTQDIIFNLHAFQKAEEIVYTDNCLYHYRMQNDSITKKFNKNADEILTRAAEAFRKFEKAYYPSDEIIRECVNYKCIIILNEIFKLKLLNPMYNTSTRKDEVKEIVKLPIYSEAIAEYDMKKYPGLLGKLKIFFLKKNMFRCLETLYRTQIFIETRRNY